MSRFTVAACQFCVSPITKFADFAAHCRRLLDQAEGADLVLFPELLTIELFTTLANWRNRPISDLVEISSFTSDYLQFFSEEAKRRNLVIGGG